MSESSKTPISVSVRDLVSVLVHDVKNPLSSMITNAQFLRDEAQAADTREAAEDVIAAAEWVNRMLSNLCDIARFAEGESEGVREGICDLVALMRQAEKTMNVHARDRDVAIALSTPGETLMIAGNGEVLLRVLETVIDACLRHAPKASNVGVSAVVTDSGVEVAFSCGGTPLEPGEREIMFTEDAFIGENSKRLRLSPTFGLSFARRAARAYGGDLVADAATSGLRLRLILPS